MKTLREILDEVGKLKEKEGSNLVVLNAANRRKNMRGGRLRDQETPDQEYLRIVTECTKEAKTGGLCPKCLLDSDVARPVRGESCTFCGRMAVLRTSTVSRL